MIGIGLRKVSAALFAPVVIGVVIPANVALRNLEELPFTGAALAAFLAIFALTALLSLLAHHWASRKRWARRIAKSLTGFALLVLLWDLLSVPAIALGLGKWPWGLAELLVAAFVVWVLRRTPVETMMRVTAAVTPVLAALTAMEAYSSLATPGAAGPAPVAQSSQSSAEASADRPRAGSGPGIGNVYHFVFDQYQTEAFIYAMERNPELAALPFTFYPEFRVNGHYTGFSNAILLRGRLYDGTSPANEWMHASYTQGLLDSLYREGIPMHLFPYYDHYCHAGARMCLSAIQLAQPLVNNSAVLIDLWFLRIIPHSPYKHPQGNSVWRYDLSVTSLFTGFSPVAFFKDFGGYTVLQFRELIHGEGERPERGQYVFAHVMLPHDPFVLDGECQLETGHRLKDLFGGKDPNRYLDHVRCANRLILEFVAELKRLDRFDDSLIIVHSDHGRFFRPGKTGALTPYFPVPTEEEKRSNFHHRRTSSDGWGSINVEMGASALLWIKFPGERAPRTSRLPMQTIDIAPTVLQHFGVPRGDYPGEAVQRLPEDWTREQLFQVHIRGKPGMLGAKLGGTSSDEVSLYRKRGGRWSFVERVDER